MMPHIPPTQVPIILVEQTIEYLGYESYANKVPYPFLKPLLQVDINKIKHWEEYYWQHCTKLITMSDEDKKFISQTTPAEKIEVVSNGVDVDWFAEKERMLPESPTVLSVGTFNWLPNVEAVNFLVHDVWPLIKKEMPQTKLWIVGNAPTPEVFEYQKKDTSITITGGIPDIRDAFVGAHVLVAPVFSGKGTRYKILEAMASGIPIVGSNLGGIPDIVKDGENGLLAKPGDVKSLADALLRLLRNEDMMKKMGDNGLKRVKDYSWDKISKETEQLYRSILED